ncbi:MAG: restriction endonuclease subunit S [Lautropia sp.]|nr:restriction endonuclease subunit S [Lautropia sp.]
MTGVEKKKRLQVPRLRFPEFRNAGAWKKFELGSFSQIITDKVGNGACVPYTITSGVGLVSQEEKYGRVTAGKSINNYVVLQKNDFAYNKSATKNYPQGFIARYSGDARAAVPGSIFTCFRVDYNKVFPGFLDGVFSNNFHGKWLSRYLSVGARAHGSLRVDNDDLMALPVPIPVGHRSVFEQQKIANFLSSLDDLIAAETRKLEALKVYRKGLLMQVFPKDGSYLPRLRFPGFKGNWRFSSLGTLVRKVGSGVTPRGGAEKYLSQGRCFVRSQNVGWGNLILDDVVYIDEITHKSFQSTEIQEGDVLLNITGASIGRSAVADSRIRGGNVNQHVCLIRLNPGLIVPIFLNQFLISDYGQGLINSFQAGGNRQGLNFGQVRSLKIPIPPTLGEQIVIANCFSALDEVVAICSHKIDALRVFKKGLLQQLFPVLDDEGTA